MSNKNNDKNKKGFSNIIFIIAAIISIFCIININSFLDNVKTKKITYSHFLKKVDKGEIKSVNFKNNKIIIISKNNERYYTGRIYQDDKIIEILKKADVNIDEKQESTSKIIIDNILNFILPIIVLWLIISLFMRKAAFGSKIMNINKSNAKLYMEKETGITFKDVAGQDEAKESLQEIVDFLYNPTKYTKIGAKLPKGLLLVGPPGTGKTLLAKAVAGEAKVPFFSLSGSSFVEMYVGVGASRVRDLFKKAKNISPCIIFIDEIDAIGKSRDSGFISGNDEREQTLNQLLAEMDGFDSNKGIMILAATNRPDVLDKALLRQGRFDRRVIVNRPDLKGRIDTLKVHSKNVKMDETVNFEEIALATSGAVGSDLANIVNESAIIAVRRKSKLVSQKDLFNAMEIVFVGKERKNKILGKEEKMVVAYHEVGHALVGAIQKDSEPVKKITIIPRTMGALGYVLQSPKEEKYLCTKKELEAMLVDALAGRAAEELVFNTITTGAANDIQVATKIAREMITKYGMSDKFGLVSLEEYKDVYLENRRISNCGNDTQSKIDEEIHKLIEVAYNKAKKILKEHRKTLDSISEYLIKKETISGKKFMNIFYKLENITKEELKNKKNENKRIEKLDDTTK